VLINALLDGFGPGFCKKSHPTVDHGNKKSPIFYRPAACSRENKPLLILMPSNVYFYCLFWGIGFYVVHHNYFLYQTFYQGLLFLNMKSKKNYKIKMLKSQQYVSQ